MEERYNIEHSPVNSDIVTTGSDLTGREDLAGLLEDVRQDIPEDMRGLIPGLPPVEQIKWIRDAQKKGFLRPGSGGGP